MADDRREWREAAYALLPGPRSWRTVVTDTGSLSGLGQVCPQQDAHPLFDLPELGRDVQGVYDCCPHVTETFYPELAAFLVALLNYDTLCAPPAGECSRTDEHRAHHWQGPHHALRCSGKGNDDGE